MKSNRGFGHDRFANRAWLFWDGPEHEHYR